ncbi:MAG TPA: beta-galactosidase [Chthoniobacterales bacterium]|jgi:hypothetical protein
MDLLARPPLFHLFQNRRLIGSLAIFGASVLTINPIAKAGVAGVPKGVFSLTAAGHPCADTVLSNPNVDGVSVRQDWAELEPSEGSFDFSFLDSQVARIAAAGKKILLRINTQAGKPSWVTNSVTAAGGVFYTFVDDFGVQNTIPVFWDPTFLAKKKAMIVALGAHFTNNPAIAIVWSSFANARSEDWNVPHTSSQVEAWQQVGYTTDKLLEAGKEIIDTTMMAFPNQYVTLAVAADGALDPDPNYAADSAIATARATWPGRLIVQKNNIAAYNPAAPGTGTVFEEVWSSRPDVAGQMLWSCYNDTTYRMNKGIADDPATILHKSIVAGAGYQMDYLEIYQVDVLNLPDEIAYAHSTLLGLAGGPKAPTGLKIAP